MSVQDIKDTFYSVLRDRIAAANPGRTIVIRGTIRPAVTVQENELPSTASPDDAFLLHWKALAIDPLGMAKLTCEIHYGTAGTTSAGGMDRGRALAAMDAELRAALSTPTQAAPLATFSEVFGGGASTEQAFGTNLFWADPVLAPLTARNEHLERSATVEVFGYE